MSAIKLYRRIIVVALFAISANVTDVYAQKERSKGKGRAEQDITLSDEEIAVLQQEELDNLVKRELELKDQIIALKEEITVARLSLAESIANTEIEVTEDEQSDISARIMDMESRLFDKSIEVASIGNELAKRSEIEEIAQIEILEVGEYIDSDILPVDSVTRLTTSRVVSSNLQLKDYNSLYEADMAEGHTYLLHREYKEHYNELRECAERYKQSGSESETMVIEREFRKKSAVVDSLSRALSKQWSAIYDDKSFVYGLLLETLGMSELLKRWDIISNDAIERAGVVKRAGVASDAVIDYEYQKRALSELEHDIATRMNMPLVIDSMDRIAHRFTLTESGEMPEVSIAARNFIVYEPLKFLAANAPHTKKAIPKVKLYSSGTVYRVLVGVFKTRQNWSAFRGAYPISYEQIEGGHFYAYYVGGFSTMMEALWAQATCKKRGFSRVDIVMWQDDAPARNLTRNPIGKSGFRVRIDNMKSVTPEIKALLDKYAGKAPLVKIGGVNYAIPNIKGYAEVEALKLGLEKIDANIKVTLTEL